MNGEENELKVHPTQWNCFHRTIYLFLGQSRNTYKFQYALNEKGENVNTADGSDQNNYGTRLHSNTRLYRLT